MRPCHVPTPNAKRQAVLLASYEISLPRIAAVIGVDTKTLRKHYGPELAIGIHKAQENRLTETLGTISKTAAGAPRSSSAAGVQSTRRLFDFPVGAAWPAAQFSSEDE